MTNPDRNISFLSAKDALAILNLSNTNLTSEDVKTAYRKAAAKYHPDHNPAGLEMMKLVNIAYDTLKAQDLTKINISPESYDYGEVVNTALNAVINLGLNLELCGVWVSGNTKPHKDTLKAAGFCWSPTKSCWYFRPKNHKSKNRKSWSMDQIRAAYVATEIKTQTGTYNQLSFSA